MELHISYLHISTLLQKLRELTSPTDEWGPALVKHRKLVTYVDDWVLDPWVERGAYDNSAFTPDMSYSPSRVSF